MKDNRLNKNFDKFEEIKRIYESGGEIRELAGEDKARIFVKGKYYPALISTRSIGDEIASQIGVRAEPHIVRYKLDDKINYYLLMCTDGIHNVVKIEDIVTIIENNDVCNIYLFFSCQHT
jgi:serine/threonine protein phosphatase PrpC